MKRILDVRPEQMIFDVDGKIVVIPNSVYYQMRYVDNNDDRIAYDFGSGMSVQETYDARIFNCDLGGQRFQFRQDLSDRLCEAIIEHKKTGKADKYQELFEFAMREVPFHDVLDFCLEHMEGVKKTPEHFLIGDNFKVDLKGNAYFWEKEHWASLCIVMQGHNIPKKLITRTGHILNVNPLTMTILAKILFLSDPNMGDRIFTSQLPKEMVISLNDDSPTIGSSVEEVN